MSQKACINGAFAECLAQWWRCVGQQSPLRDLPFSLVPHSWLRMVPTPALDPLLSLFCVTSFTTLPSTQEEDNWGWWLVDLLQDACPWQAILGILFTLVRSPARWPAWTGQLVWAWEQNINLSKEKLGGWVCMRTGQLDSTSKPREKMASRAHTSLTYTNTLLFSGTTVFVLEFASPLTHRLENLNPCCPPPGLSCPTIFTVSLPVELHGIPPAPMGCESDLPLPR